MDNMQNFRNLCKNAKDPNFFFFRLGLECRKNKLLKKNGHYRSSQKLIWKRKFMTEICWYSRPLAVKVRMTENI